MSYHPLSLAQGFPGTKCHRFFLDWKVDQFKSWPLYLLERQRWCQTSSDTTSWLLRVAAANRLFIIQRRQEPLGALVDSHRDHVALSVYRTRQVVTSA